MKIYGREGLMLGATLTWLVSGCVSSGTYEALQQEHDGLKKKYEVTTQDLDGTSAELAELNKKLRTYVAEQKRLQQAMQAAGDEKELLVEEIKRLVGEQSRLSAELTDVVKDKSRLRASVDDMRQALAEMAKRKAAAERRMSEYKKLLARFKKLIDSGKLKVKIVDGRMVVALATDVLFSSGSAGLTKDGKAAMAEVAGVLADIPDRAYQVEGHTDNVPIRTPKYPSNWELAAARSITVVNALVDGGLPASRVSAASFGENKPAAINETSEGRAANRRIEIVVVPDLSTLPGFDELSKAAEG